MRSSPHQLLPLLLLIVGSTRTVEGFLSHPQQSSFSQRVVIQQQQPRKCRSHSPLQAFWRHWIPSQEVDLLHADLYQQEEEDCEQHRSSTEGSARHHEQSATSHPSVFHQQTRESTRSSSSLANAWLQLQNAQDSFLRTTAVGLSVLLLVLTMNTSSSWAVSGGGLDYAGLDISGQDYSSAKAEYKGKDFTQVLAKNTNFANSNLQGCRFYKAYLVNADFSGADLTGVSLEDTSMDGASLKGTVAVGSYFSKSILDTASVENADFTDASFPVKTIPLLCAREDLKGSNPITGVDTRDSVMCP